MELILVAGKQSLVSRAMGLLKRLASDPSYRSQRLLSWRKPRNLFQPFNYTSHDRHPGIFAFTAATLRSTANPSILSFGCSTGEEVATLRKYFLQARIKGVDINPYNITCCRRALGDDRNMEFVLGSDAAREPAGHYDAVFALSVFRHGALAERRWDRCDKLIDFAAFEKTVAQLVDCLRPGGLLVVAASNFRLRDTAAAARLEMLLTLPPPIGYHPTPIFDRNNKRTGEENYMEVVFRKKASAAH